MKKLITLTIALLLALSLVGSAMADAVDAYKLLAKPHLPQDAVFLGHEVDGGLYELKFWTESTKERYEVHINPATSAIVKISTELWQDKGSKNVVLTQEKIKEMVLALYPSASILSAELENDDGLYEYDVIFSTPEFSGKFTFNPESGMILEREFAYGAPEVSVPALSTKKPAAPVNQPAAEQSGAVSAEQAKAMVLGRLQNGKITQFKQDTEDGRPVFEGEAVDGNYEYDFEIEIASGRFLKWEMEAINKTPQPTSSGNHAGNDNSNAGNSAVQPEPTAPALIGTARAKQIALAKSGGGKVVSIKQDTENGRIVYEGKIVKGKYEYEFDIDAKSGTVLDWDVDEIETDEDDD